MDLPAQLHDITPERRIQLQQRQRREMALQQQQNLRPDLIRVSPFAMIPAHVFDLIFFILLLFQLQGVIAWAWAAVLAPLWAADCAFLTIKTIEMVLIYRHAVAREFHLFVSPLCGIIDYLGVAATKGWLVFHLEGWTSLPLLLIFLPHWVSVLISGVLKCVGPALSGWGSMEGRGIFSHRLALISGFLHFLLRGIQPALVVARLDHIITGRWTAIFIPSWTFLFFLACIGFCLVNYLPLAARAVPHELRPLLVRLILLCIAITLSLTVCGFMFLDALAIHLDGTNPNITPAQILVPLIVLYTLLLFLLSFLLLTGESYRQTITEVADNLRAAADPQNQGAEDVPRGEVSPMTRTIIIVRHGNVFKKMSLGTVAADSGVLLAEGLAGINVPTHTPSPGSPHPTGTNNSTTHRSVGRRRFFADQIRRSSQMSMGDSISSCEMEMSNWSQYSGVSAASREEKGTLHLALDIAQDPRFDQMENRIPSHSKKSSMASMGHDVSENAIERHRRPSVEAECHCFVCWSEPPSCVLLDCGHSGLCYACGTALANQSPQQCPVCRQPLTQVLKVEKAHLESTSTIFLKSNEGLIITRDTT